MPTPTAGHRTSIFDYSAYAFLTGGQVVTELLLVRHGQQEAGVAGGPFADLVDPPLSRIAANHAGSPTASRGCRK